MYRSYFNNQTGSFLTRMIITLVILAILAFIIMRIPFSTIFIDKTLKEELKNQNIDISDYSKILDATQKKAEKIDEAARKREKMLEEIGNQ